MEAALKQKVGWLNKQGGFGGTLIYDKIQDAAQGVDPDEVMRVLDQLEAKIGEVNNPNSWVCAALRKSAGRAQSGIPASSDAGLSNSGELDLTKLQMRVHWLNTVGGFNGALNYDKVEEAAVFVDTETAMKILTDVEQKIAEVNNPTAYVCAAMRRKPHEGKIGSTMSGSASGGSAMDRESYWTMPASGPAWASMAVDTTEDDQKLRKRIGWLNSQGGFEGQMKYTRISEASEGVSLRNVMEVLKEAEEKKDQLKDPTAWVVGALRRRAGGGAPAGPLGAMPLPANYSMAYMGSPAGIYGSDPAVDEKLRKRIGWLNGVGGFNGEVNYKKIQEHAQGIDGSSLMTILKQLEEKKDQINDPTGWVVVALKKKAVAAWSHGLPGAYMQDAGGFVDVQAEKKLQSRVNWLNGHGGFEGALNYEKIKEAAVGVNSTEAMKVLKDAETNKDTITNPTAYVTSALRRARVGAGGMPGGMPASSKRGIPLLSLPAPVGVRKIILKLKH